MSAEKESITPCFDVGWADKEIGSDDLLSLWERYDTDHDGKLSQTETITLFKDLGRILGIPIRKNKATFLYNAHASDPALGLSQTEFLNMFVETIPQNRLELTASLEGRRLDQPPEYNLHVTLLNAPTPPPHDRYGRKMACSK